MSTFWNFVYDRKLRSFAQSSTITDIDGDVAFPGGYYSQQKVSEIYNITKEIFVLDQNMYISLYSYGSGSDNGGSGFSSSCSASVTITINGISKTYSVSGSNSNKHGTSLSASASNSYQVPLDVFEP